MKKLDLCGQIVGMLFCSVEDETNCMTGRALGFLTFLGLQAGDCILFLWEHFLCRVIASAERYCVSEINLF